ncbi:L,D-transpeptidase catalytic domain [Prosthecobacter debontii]|uniref:L,D-transpeptidase catalytic domain n=1 Tax=Prosthecobacter debontii TaxID=48467 RepID=A0A1T4XZA9_9BACT|nr:L,D-transpeptidase family protein [Prosthecobacter debontii]SKA94365.1 L,D-transpeptidase catalytic domain [Prosthecobacter debontii]
MKLLKRLAFLAASVLLGLHGVSCSSPEYREIRRPAPGGGFYVQRIRIEPQEAAKLKKQKKDKKKKADEPIDDGSWWHGDGVEGKPSMKISLSEQKVYFMKDGVVVGMSPISSGREGYDTRPGKFRVMEKDIDHKSNLYGDYVDADGVVLKKDIGVMKDKRPPGAKFDGANMRYFMRVTGAIGMHEGYLPGFPASHGCIRLPTKMAEIFYHQSSVGTPVEIVP